VENSQKYLDPQTLARIKDLELVARRLVEGFVSGGHKSPFQGVSVEFAEHREYVPGDDIRRIDWKVFGKTDKYYTKRYEQETNLVCNLVLDTSQSMSYASRDASKLLYASYVAASLAYLILHQQDSVGMTFFEDRVRYLVPPSGQASHLKQLLHLLAVCQPANLRSRVGKVLDELADRFRKRSLVIILSDCFDDKRHEVVLFHILDPAELDFPFEDVTLFKGLESLPEVMADPRGLRKAYQESFGGYLRTLEGACRATDVEYHRIRTNQRVDLMLASYLAGRLTRV
jgi:uncharacterized protein (DUF58 family)